MVRRSGRIRSKQLKLDGLRCAFEDDANANAGAQENNEADSSSGIPLSISSAREKALRNPVILHHLFQLCSSTTVALCRLVCKQWYDESLAIWRTTFPFYVMLQNTDIFLGKPYHRKRRSTNRTPLKEFLEFVGKSENQCDTKPYRSMELSSCRYNLTYEGFNVLWEAVGSNLTTLNLSRCQFSSIEDFRQVIFKYCPVLQKLNVINCQFPRPQNAPGIEGNNGVEYSEPVYGEHKFLRSLEMTVHGETKTFPVSWIELFSHFRLLTSLKVSLFGDAGAEFDILMEAIKVIRKRDKKKLPFQRFEFSPQLVISREPASHRQFTLVKELHLPLTNCSIRVHPELDQRFVRHTLEQLAGSVQAIELMQGELDNEGRYQAPTSEVDVPPWFLDFPFGIQLSKLKKLKSRGNSCGTFTFLKYAPNLSRLDIVNPYPKDTGVTLPVMKAVSNACIEELANVKMLRLRNLAIMELIVSDEDLQHLLNWMPNITDLEMVLNRKQLRMVCENWKEIRRLSVFGGNPLTGKKGKKMKTNEIIDLVQMIEKLKCLEYLFIDNPFDADYAINLFLQLPTLQTLCDRNTYVDRHHLDLEYYREAIEKNVFEQWVADNRPILQEGEDEESLGSFFTESD